MTTLRLAYRNLIGAGLRTWLNVIVLSLSYVVIIWHWGILQGWHEQARRDMIDWEIGGGQYWHEKYDPYDPLMLSESHAPIPPLLNDHMAAGTIAPILIVQGTIFPGGRMQNVLLKGIERDQRVLSLPSHLFPPASDEIPAVIGTGMARSAGLSVGDFLTVRWRDAQGVFDAAEVKIVGIFKTNVPTVDGGQLWIPLDRLQSMMQIPGEATILVMKAGLTMPGGVPGWVYRDHGYLLAEVDEIIRQKSIGGSVLYVILLLLAMLAIFDTQVLSIFRRRKEIGTYMALGMTRTRVVGLFTLEGAMHAVLAALVGAAYGVPLLATQAVTGLSIPFSSEGYGLTIAEKIFPTYSAGLIISTLVIVFITTTIVSFLPARTIAKMKATEALKGKAS